MSFDDGEFILKRGAFDLSRRISRSESGAWRCNIRFLSMFPAGEFPLNPEMFLFIIMEKAKDNYAGQIDEGGYGRIEDFYFEHCFRSHFHSLLESCRT